jgi:hypothetical protein
MSQSRIPFARRHAERAEQILPPGYVPPVVEPDLDELDHEDDLTPAAVARPRQALRGPIRGIMLTTAGLTAMASAQTGRAYAAGGTDQVPVVNVANWQTFVGVAVSLILTVTGLQMLAGHRKSSVRKQAEHGLSAMIALLVIALGLAGAVGLAWAKGMITFFGA